MKKMIAAVLLAALTASASAFMTWRLIGQSYNIDTQTSVCTYEGRTSDGRLTTTTVIVRSFWCPNQPGGSW